MSDQILKSILVPVDFSPPSQAALDAAAEVAQRTKARLEVLHIFQLPVYAFLDVTWIPSAEEAARIAAFAQQKLDAMVAALRPKHPGLVIESKILNGATIDEIVDTVAKRTPDLVVMGTHGKGFWSRALLGSVSRKILRRCAVPVLSVHGPAAGDDSKRAGVFAPGTVLVALDVGDPASEKALDFAMILAKALGAKAKLLFCYSLYDAGYPFPEAGTAALVEEAARRALERVIAERRGCGVALESAVYRGSPVAGILEAAGDPSVGMVVMGTHERTVSERVLSGSVAEDVVRLAPCPVVTLMQGKDEAEA